MSVIAKGYRIQSFIRWGLLRSLLRCLDLLGDVRQCPGRPHAEHPPPRRQGQRSSGHHSQDIPRLLLQDRLPPLRPLNRQELAHGLRLCSPQPHWQWGRRQYQWRKRHLAGMSYVEHSKVMITLRLKHNPSVGHNPHRQPVDPQLRRFRE